MLFLFRIVATADMLKRVVLGSAAVYNYMVDLHLSYSLVRLPSLFNNQGSRYVINQGVSRCVALFLVIKM